MVIAFPRAGVASRPPCPLTEGTAGQLLHRVIADAVASTRT